MPGAYEEGSRITSQITGFLWVGDAGKIAGIDINERLISKKLEND